MGQTFVNGVINGLSISLLAVGLVLVYKANRFINLAHAQLGTLSALILAKIVIDLGVTWWLAFPTAVGVGIGTGIAVERLVIRPLRERDASTESLLLVSIGVAQLLLALVFVPALGPDAQELTIRGYPLPFDASIDVLGFVLGTQHLLILVLVPALVGGLAVFLRRSVTGKMIRAAADNPTEASLCGISIGRVSAVTWGVAGGFSAISAVLIAPAQASFDAAQLGPGLLLRALGAAALGGFVSIPAALCGGLLLGLVEQFALYQTSDGAQSLLVVFVAILVIFVTRGRVINAAVIGDGISNALRAPVRIPPEIADLPIVRYRRTILAVAVGVVLVVLPHLPFLSAESDRFQLSLILVYALVGLSLTLVVGWAGQISLGHFALVGVGAFITARLAPHEWSMPALVLLSGLAGAFVFTLIGIPALRLKGLTLAVTTLGFAVVAPGYLFRQDWFGSDTPFGLIVEPVSFARGLGAPFEMIEVYYTGLALLGLGLLAASAIRHSVPGRLVLAVRDNEAAAASLGVTPATVKLGIFAVSGFIAASSGVVWAQALRNVAGNQFPAALSLSILAVPVIGGLGSLGGAVAGAFALYLPAFLLESVAEAVFGEFGRQAGFQIALSGLGLVGVLLAAPGGIAGLVDARWSAFLERVAADHRSRPDRTTEHPLVTSDVTVAFGGLQALAGASIEVRRGEIVGLIGPNGAGKSTLLDAISGTLTPDEGSIRIFGNEVADLAPEFRTGFGVARTFQDARLFPGLTVLETVQVALSHRNRVGLVSAALYAPWVRAVERSTRAQALDILERLNLLPWKDVLTSDLSTGTRRICDLATQLAAGPELLLLDEPTGGVAQRETETFPPLLRRIRDELGCSILIVEHDMPMLMGLCDRIYAMEAGVVIAEGTPDEVRDDPLVIASYLGTDAAAINRSGATAHHDGAGGDPGLNGSNGRRKRQLRAVRT